MLAYLGNIILFATLCFAVFQIIIFNKKNDYLLVGYKKLAINGLLFGATFSFFALMYGHIVSDFSLLNVYQNSHTSKPFLYKISGVWGNHEGSMLLWILVLAVFNYFIFKLYNKFHI